MFQKIFKGGTNIFLNYFFRSGKKSYESCKKVYLGYQIFFLTKKKIGCCTKFPRARARFCNFFINAQKRLFSTEVQRAPALPRYLPRGEVGLTLQNLEGGVPDHRIFAKFRHFFRYYCSKSPGISPGQIDWADWSEPTRVQKFPGARNPDFLRFFEFLGVFLPPPRDFPRCPN